jgi:tetratricopeptide (TPR) repeat protein
VRLINKISEILFLVIITSSFSIGPALGQTSEESKLFDQANEYFKDGQYKESITIYDEILVQIPNNISTLKMKGIAQSNLGNHEESLKQFFTILQYKPDDVIALTGMGVGFGNLGEYQEAKNYFEKALEKKPDSTVIKNYKEFVDNIISKYPYTPTEKPGKSKINSQIKIPSWIKSVANWWSQGQIEDEEFVKALHFLIENKIINLQVIPAENNPTNKIPNWIRENSGWWVNGKINDQEFASGLQYMMENGIIKIEIQQSLEELQKEKDAEFILFEKYLREVSKNIAHEKRYIEYPNPSDDVIKKFLRDYIKWNFEQEVKSASGNFPDPSFEVIDEVYVIHYKVFINEQPTGLPLDHVSTLKNSFEFWEAQELTINDKTAKFEFDIINEKQDANVWITWVIRNLGDGVLGHAHLGKGVVEVALGDFNCDGSFQLYDVKSVEKIMTHELGHSVGLPHVDDSNNIMYPSMSPKYAYCLLS